jgi:hypothetical protein
MEDKALAQIHQGQTARVVKSELQEILFQKEIEGGKTKSNTFEDAVESQTRGNRAALFDASSDRNLGLEAIKGRNKKALASEGISIIKELPGGWSIGVNSRVAGSEVSRVLISPQGSPVLFGRTEREVLSRGFTKKDLLDLGIELPNK